MAKPIATSYRFQGNLVLVNLSQDKVATIDRSDYGMICGLGWYAVKNQKKRGSVRWYAGAKISGKLTFMHMVIAGRREGLMVDHKDGNGLNNRRENLRHVSNGMNMANIHAVRGNSKYKGVCWHIRDKKFDANIRIDGCLVGLGRFDCEEDAARAYDIAALAAWGEFACLNSPLPS